jgi:CBS domain-containing protein
MNGNVATARPNDSLARISAEMERRKIGSVVIVQNRGVVGILTERDFTRIVKQGIMHGRDRAKHHMTKPVFTVRSDVPVADAIILMRRKHVRHLPVLDKRRRLVGILSSRDLMNAVSEVIAL